jgi:hypothetical protein
VKNSIEETIKQLELMLKVRKEQKEIIECAGGSCMNCDPDIKALSKSIEILSDYRRVKEENKKLKEMYYKFAKLILENFVSVRKIERQIEILDDNINTYNNTQRMFEKFLYAKKVLKGLLKNIEYTKKEV